MERKTPEEDYIRWIGRGQMRMIAITYLDEMEKRLIVMKNIVNCHIEAAMHDTRQTRQDAHIVTCRSQDLQIIPNQSLRHQLHLLLMGMTHSRIQTTRRSVRYQHRVMPG
jgi:hypothetical protein